MPVTYVERCNGCGLCVGVCPCKSIVLVDNVVSLIQTEECDWCLECEAVCPNGAIACPFEIVIE